MFLVSYYMAVFIVVGASLLSVITGTLFGTLSQPSVLVLSWGAFPILTAYYAQHATVNVAALPPQPLAR